MLLNFYCCAAVSCQTLPQLKNGLCQGTALTFGSKVDCACNAGHVMVGKSLRTCLDNGMWSNSDITCDRKCMQIFDFSFSCLLSDCVN